MTQEINRRVVQLLKDNRPCKSNNLQQFFRSRKGRQLARHIGWFKETDGMRVIRFEGDLWFATLGWLTSSGKEDGFAGVTIREVACFGRKATTGYPNWQKGGDYEDVTDWFWQQYAAFGVVAFPDIWHIEPIKQLSHSEKHTL